ncbi:MAG: type II toxin-antitoxin system HicA family toxin [Campylobacteraceae bacterium]
MSKYDKLLEKIKNNPKNIDFDTIKKLLEKNGYECFNTGGSHYVFRKKSKESIAIPYNKPIKAIYVKQVLKVLEEDN